MVGGSDGENLPSVQETLVHSLGWEDPLKKGMATHPSVLACRNAWAKKLGQATVHGVSKSQTQLSNKAHSTKHIFKNKTKKIMLHEL